MEIKEIYHKNIAKEMEEKRERMVRNEWCHHCRTFKEELVECDKKGKEVCSAKYCINCMERIYSTNAREVCEKERWEC